LGFCRHLTAGTPLTHEVIKAVGEVDDRVVADLVGKGVTAEELAHTRAWIDALRSA
jgi:hypothetical protein